MFAIMQSINLPQSACTLVSFEQQYNKKYICVPTLPFPTSGYNPPLTNPY